MHDVQSGIACHDEAVTVLTETDLGHVTRLKSTAATPIICFPFRNHYTLNISCYTWLLRYTVAQWLRHCATNRKVVISIPDYVTGLYH
jgi:hypothetical protein